jgi:Tol biopolymer transport system component
VSTDAAGSQGNDGSEDARFSADGHSVLFVSLASNLVAGDSNGAEDLFIKNLQSGAIQRVSTDAAGVQGNSSSLNAQFSADGRYVVFQSYASNLVAGDSNGDWDLFVKDLQSGAIQRVSTDAAGAESNGYNDQPRFSSDGRHVVFQSYASNLVAGDSNGTGDIFVKNLQSGAIQRVSADAAGVQGNSDSGYAQFSADGRTVLFQSLASNLVAGDSNGASDIFVKDLQSGAIQRVSTDAAGVQDNGFSYNAWFSADGRTVVFTSEASNLVAGDSNISHDVFVKDLQSGAIQRVSAEAAGAQGNAGSFNPQFSADGRTVVFTSEASNLVAGDSNGAGDIFRVANPFHIDSGVDTVQSSISYTLPTAVENLTLTGTANIDGTGNSLANKLTGNQGNNILDGLNGADILDGAAGADTLIGGDGNDLYIVDNVGDLVTETNSVLASGGNDTVYSDLSAYTLGANVENGRIIATGTAMLFGNRLNNTLTAGAGNNVLYGNSGIDTVSYAHAASAVTVNIAEIAAQATGGSGSDTLIAIENLTGSSYNDTLGGNNSANILDGGAGNDTLAGGLGNDTYVINTLADLVTEKVGRGYRPDPVGDQLQPARHRWRRSLRWQRREPATHRHR